MATQIEQFDRDCAFMAGAAYVSSRPNEINRFPVPDGWIELVDEHKFDDSSGFEAVSLRNTTTNEIVISFAGTYDKDFTGDWLSDAGLATAFGSTQLLQAAEYYMQIRKKYSDAKITFTGHSLGGGLAALMGVFFGKTAKTFDQAPFQLSATDAMRDWIKRDLLSLTDKNGQPLYTEDLLERTEPELLSFSRDSTDNDVSTRMKRVSGYVVNGEFLTDWPVVGWFPQLGEIETLSHGNTDLSGPTLHSQALLTAFLENEDFRKITSNLPDMLRLIFDDKLYNSRTDSDKENFIDRLVRYQTGTAPQATASNTKMLDRFTLDMQKIAKDGGLTMADPSLTKALIAFAMQMYYSGPNATNKDKTLFTDVTGGLRFDRSDVAGSLDNMKGYKNENEKGNTQYFQDFLATLPVEVKDLITQQLPDLRDWFIQAGTQAMNATAGTNSAFMLGGTGNDTLTGGSQADLLIGGSGNDYLDGGEGDDTMIGGDGEDTYVIKGHDRIVDTGKNVIIFRDTNGQEVTAAGTFTPVSGSGGSSFESDEINSDGTPKYTFSFHSPGVLTFGPEDSVTFVNQTSAAGFADHDFGITLQEEDPDEFDITLTGSASRNEMGIFDIGLDQKNWQLYFVSFPDPHWVNLHGSGWSDDPASWQDPEDENSPVILYEENLPEIAPRMKISGGDAGNFLFGFAGHDEITGGAGGDIITGYLGGWNGKELTQTGDLEGDLLDGGDGGDWIHGAGADDQLIGGGGNDLLTGLDGDDSIRGDEGNDIMAGGSHADTLSGGDGDDILLGEGYFTSSLELNLDNLASLGFDLTGPGADYYTGYTTIGFAIHNDAPNGGDDVLLGGAGRDWLEGGAGADILDGGTESDSLFGGTGDDWLSGGDGNDWMVGDSLDPAVIGNDIMLGGAGDDTYVVNSVDDIIIEEVDEGTDTIQSSVSFALPENVEHITFTGDGDLNATGNASDNFLGGSGGANILSGNAGNDTINGFAGNDVLDGGEGLDWMEGGLGNDTYIVDNAGDVVVENAGEGTDTIQASISYSLGANVENLTLTGDAEINGTGNTLNNVLTGNSAANTLTGGAGNDTLDGGEGIDTMLGGVGNDIYIVDNEGDIVVENVNQGTDTVQSSITTTLSANVENLTLMGTAAINGTGNTLDNVLVGNSEANMLMGDAGNDTLDGAAGADIMIGGLGNDIYIVDIETDVIMENAAEGTDTVKAGLTYSLGDNVENLTLTGTDALNGTGNELDNILIGNSAANTLTGGAGNDTLDGGAGSDTLIGGLGDDIYVVDVATDVISENAGEGIDTVQAGFTSILAANLENLTLTGTAALNGTGNELDNILIGNSAANTLTGGVGNDTLDGGAGVDKMIGGLGDDTYMVNVATDVITENENEGTDTVQASATYTLGANIENLTLMGTAALGGTGNELDNVLTGNNGANTLNGGTGADKMLGGLGNDIYIVDNAGDTVVENVNEGTDTVQSGITYTLTANVENLTLIGTSAINGIGNELDNVLTGNSAVNILAGGLGNDTYILDNIVDIISENASEGTDTVQSSVTISLSANVENLTLTGTAALNGTGNELDNILTGNSAANTLIGGAGNDTLNGGAGADTMLGGLGDDTYMVDSVTDVITEYVGEGTDTVQASTTYSLSADVENLTLMGTAALNGIGNELDNILTGNSAANTLIGGAGNDTLNGGAGADTMLGGLGNDTYVVNLATDVVNENADEGIDTVQAGITYSLGANIENLILTGTAALNGTGNELDNILIGNSAANILTGGAGADQLKGGAGNDTYVVDNAGDLVTENANEGTDTVQSSISYTLGANLENLTLTGSADINGTGNEQNNIITGSSGANILDGGIGADRLIGGAGDDVYDVDNSGDVIVEKANEGIDTVQSNLSYNLGANVENLILTGTGDLNGTGNGLNNVITGNSGSNILDGGLGNDLLVGGDGNDTYVVDNVLDAIIENADEGVDSVQSSVAYTLGADLENLLLTGISDINGTGNALDNILIGNNGANTIIGGEGEDIINGEAGTDTMIGGLGDDLYIVDNITDIVIENADEGVDSVQSSVTYVLGENVENLILTGTTDINGTGNMLDNVLIGNSTNNTLDGGSGADTLIGGLGNDRYFVDNAEDIVIENANEGIDSVQSSISYILGDNIENVYLIGTANINGTGNALNNRVCGNNGANTIDGGAGADWMSGSLGDDTYIVDNAGDSIYEIANQGTDSVQSSVSFTLENNVENLMLTGTEDINGTGNALDNVLVGNSGANTLIGGGGNNTMIGGHGNDILTGGKGNDIFEFNLGDGQDTIISEPHHSDGIDTLAFGVGIARSDLQFFQISQYDLVIKVGNSGDQVKLVNLLTQNSSSNCVDSFSFADGTVLTTDQLVAQRMIYGTEGDDILGINNNTEGYGLDGGAGNDSLYGSYVNDILIGGPGDDSITGGEGNDDLSGGLGNDSLYGGGGDNIFRFNLGNGQDTINADSNYGHNTLAFGAGITLSNLQLYNVPGDAIINYLSGELVIKVGDGDDQVRLARWYTSDRYYNHLDNFSFADGTVLTRDQFFGQLTVYGSEAADTFFGDDVTNDRFDGGGGDDTLSGYAGNDNLAGGDGNDTLDGGVGDDELTGESGNDILYGGTGNDIFHFNIGDGDDTIMIDDINGTDTLAFGEGITLPSLRFVEMGNDLVIKVGDAGDQVKLADWNNPNKTGYRLDRISFVDGTVVTAAQLAAKKPVLGTAGDDTLSGMGTANDWFDGGAGNDTLSGNAGNDVLQGGAGNDILQGGVGNDDLIGGAGDDIFRFNLGDGQDTIWPDNIDGIDTLAFGAGISSADLTLFKVNNDLVIKIGAAGDQIKLVDWFIPSSSRFSLDRFSFVDGTVLTNVTLFEQKTVYGTTGADTFYGIDAANNWFDGGDGDDKLVGKLGNDLLIGGHGNDILVGSNGNDILIGGVGKDTLQGDNGNDELSGGPGNDTLTGGAGDDIFRFNLGDGQDTINFDGTTGIDTLVFGPGILPSNLQLLKTGNDLVIKVGDAGDQVMLANYCTTSPPGFYSSPMQSTIDRITFADSNIILNNDEIFAFGMVAGTAGPDTLSGIGADNDWFDGGAEDDTLIGNEGNDLLKGGTGNDTLQGGDGNDELIGGQGDDILSGGTGVDIFRFNLGDGHDIINTDTNPGKYILAFGPGITLSDLQFFKEGTYDLVIKVGETGDQVKMINWYNQSSFGLYKMDYFSFADNSYWNYSLEESILLHKEVHGTADDDVFYGNCNFTPHDYTEYAYPGDWFDGGAGNDTLYGYRGNDILDGGIGADTLIGGMHDDTYIVDNIGDIVIENFREGKDTVQSSINYTLGANIENLTLTGALDINGTGNELDNLLIGNSGANTLTGGAGNDSLNGGDGNDIISGGLGDDVYIYNRGDGQDSIDDLDKTGGADTLRLGKDITESDVLALRSGDNLFFNIKNSDDQICFMDYYAADTTIGQETFDHKVNRVVFDNTVIWDQAMIQTVIDRAGNNHAPVVNSSLPTIQANAGNLFTSIVPAAAITDPDPWDSITYSVQMQDGSDLPAWLTFDAATRTLSGTPGINDVGNLQFVLRGTDNYNLSAEELVTLNIIPPNRAPVVATALPDKTAELGDVFTYTIAAASFTDPDAGDALSYSATLADGSALPSWLSFNPATGTFSGTPSALGTINVKVTAMDKGNLTVSDIFDLSVTIQDLTLTGTTGADTLNGGAGNDTLSGLAGNDTINGKGGNDYLDGGADADTMLGGAGDDTYLVDNSGDIVTENADEGTDTVQSGISYTLASNVENLTLTGTSAINGTGNALNNVIIGNSAANTLNGGTGADTLFGGLGDDTYIVDNAGDIVTENVNEGTDLVQSSATFTLFDFIENLTLTGSSAINGTGNSLDNVLTGNGAVNTLTGGAGNDTLNGGAGADKMLGGLGNDTYVVDNTGDVITENAGEGTDTVQSSKTFTLANNVENLTLTGTSAINGTGNGLDNVLLGNSAANTLTGGAGNDILNGGSGADKMFGGLGNDTYVVDKSTDVVTENAGEGTDTVLSGITYTLGSNVENLTLTGSAASKGTGNTLNNVLVGNSGANTLSGGTGNDILDGGLGKDTLTGGAGNDFFVFDTALSSTANIDSITDFTVGLDKIQLDREIFTALTEEGALSSAFFRSGTNGVPLDENDYFLYNTTSGALFYDADGNGQGVAVQFATLTTKPAVTANDFLVVS